MFGGHIVTLFWALPYGTFWVDELSPFIVAGVACWHFFVILILLLSIRKSVSDPLWCRSDSAWMSWLSIKHSYMHPRFLVQIVWGPLSSRTSHQLLRGLPWVLKPLTCREQTLLIHDSLRWTWLNHLRCFCLRATSRSSMQSLRRMSCVLMSPVGFMVHIQKRIALSFLWSHARSIRFRGQLLKA